MKYIYYGCSVLAVSSVLFGCSPTTETSIEASLSGEKIEQVAESINVSYTMVDPGYSNRDIAGTWDESDVVNILLKGSDIEISGSGALASGNILTISKEGTYVLNGDLNGQIIVDATNTEKVQLVLNGVDITSTNGPAIYVKQADKVFTTIAEGTENSVSDGENYQVDGDENHPNGAIFSQDDLTINGSGTLTVNGNYNHGVVSKDDLVITGGNISVNALNNGLRGKDSVAIYDGDLTITSGGDGIKSNNSTDLDKGWVSIDGGKIQIEAELGDGIQSETILQMTAGDVNILTGGGSENAEVKTESMFQPRFFQDQEDTDEESTSMKGLKSGAEIFIAGGQLEIDAQEDAIHSDSNVTVEDGTLILSSGDDGIHADYNVQIDGGDILIHTSYEGVEGDTIYINGGEIRLTATDDGINASGNTSYLEINGGLLVVNASGDGIDSNADILMTGGTVLVSGPTSNGNSSLDHDGEATITGGVFVAAGSSGMMEPFDSSSTQASIVYEFSAAQSAGTLMTLVDENGETIVSFEPSKDYQGVIISAPELEEGNTYSLYTDGKVADLNEDGLSYGSFTPGTLASEINLTSVVTIAGNNQTMGGGPEGEMGGQPGGRPGEQQGGQRGMMR